MSISIAPVIFYGFAGIALISAMMVISLHNTVHCVLALVLTFFATAALWMLLHAEFLSLILVLVYVGAVMTLFLFVVMMLNVNADSRRRRFGKYFPFSILCVVLFIAAVLTALYAKGMNNYFPERVWLDMVEQESNTKMLGLALFNHYVYAFELAGMLLLAAMIAAIALVHRGMKPRKNQTVSQQLDANPQNCVKLISMPPARPSSQRINDISLSENLLRTPSSAGENGQRPDGEK